MTATQEKEEEIKRNEEGQKRLTIKSVCYVIIPFISFAFSFNDLLTSLFISLRE